eukprot:SAG31_NODE_848_length_11534_cov_8.897463_13_plen_196_part_00
MPQQCKVHRRFRRLAAELTMPNFQPSRRLEPPSLAPATAAASGGGGPLAAVLPLQLQPRCGIDENGWFCADLAATHAALSVAVSAGNYRAAAALQDLVFVAEPKPALSVRDCAPQSPDAAADFFLENGFVVIEQLFDAAKLARIQAAWQRAQAPARQLWEHAKSLGRGTQGLYFENQREVNAQPELQGLPHGRLL